ncbi:MAG: hypothetical protein IJC66_02410, partial [Kiritimatiellae bacterium]|nr:hypothetical protein [Kiritimatiellia bacterium]
VERATDAPEGNLVFVEGCARERQRLCSCREYGCTGTAHALTSTPYDRLVTHTRHYLHFDKHYIRQCLIK